MAKRSPEDPTSPRRGLLFLLLAGVLIFGLATVLLILSAGDEPRPNAQGQGGGPPPDQIHPTKRPIEQAPWRIHVYPAGAVTKLTAHQRARVKTQRERLADSVRNLFDAQYFSPEAAARPVAEKTFAPAAARRWLSARSGPPQGLAKLRTVARTARIGVNARTAKQAAATVRIVARGRRGQREARFAQVATLWLERAGGRWRVIAFVTDRRELSRPGANHDQSKKGGEKKGSSHSKDGGKRSGGSR